MVKYNLKALFFVGFFMCLTGCYDHTKKVYSSVDELLLACATDASVEAGGCKKP